MEVKRLPNPSPGQGAVLSAEIELFDQHFILFNGGPQFKFSQAISLFVHCEDQAEVDDYYTKLSLEGKEQACGWLTDKFGLSWQIIPTSLNKFLTDTRGNTQAALDAMLQMKKINITQMEAAWKK